MKELIGFELRKIYSKKIMYITIFTVALFILSSAWIEWFQINKQVGGMAEFKEAAKSYEGFYDEARTEELLKEVEACYMKLSNDEVLTKEEYKLINLYYYLNLDRGKTEETYYAINEEKYTVEEIKALQGQFKHNSYEYKNFEKALSMIGEEEKKEIKYIGGWRYITDFNVAGSMMMLLIIIGLSRLFSEEYSENTIAIILSTKKGRKEHITAKMIAAFLHALGVWIVVNILYLLSGLPFGLEGSGEPFKKLFPNSGSIYSFTISEAYMRAIMISLIAAIALAMVVCLISLVSKNSMITILVTFAIYFGPSVLCVFLPLPKWLINAIGAFQIENLMQARRIVTVYETYNVFGTPVLYGVILASCVIVSTLIIVGSVKYLGKRQSL